MAKNHVLMALVAVVMCTMLTGCFAVFSQQRYGPQNLGSVTDMQNCLKDAGGPDVIHKSANDTVYIYRTLEGLTVLGLFGFVEKKDRVIVFDNAGKMTSDKVVDKGKGLFVIGAMCPINEID